MCDRNKRKAVTRIEKIYVRTYTERKIKRWRKEALAKVNKRKNIEEGKEYEEIFKRNDRYYGTYYPYIITKSGVCGGECIVKGIDRITNFETTDI